MNLLKTFPSMLILTHDFYVSTPTHPIRSTVEQQNTSNMKQNICHINKIICVDFSSLGESQGGIIALVKNIAGTDA